MSHTLARVPGGSVVSRRDHSAVARRIRYASEAPAGSKVLRAYQQPRRCFAIEEAVDLPALEARRAPEEPDQIVVAMVGPDAVSEARRLAETWMAPQADEVFASALAFTISGQKIQWRPGRALVQAPAEAFDDILIAIADFAFYETELQRLEASLAGYEAMAPADAARAHRIRFRDRKHWRRIGETIEMLYQMRLTYARLESQVVAAPTALSREARQILTRLVDESGISDRLETFSDRLEACEDLYEGANDRIADYRWYIGGHWLEFGIIVLLLMEVVLMAADVYLRHGK